MRDLGLPPLVGDKIFRSFRREASLPTKLK
jgi:hypothetical protein